MRRIAFNQVFKVWVGLMLAWAATSAWATSDITDRDLQALRNVRAVAMLTPEIDDVAFEAGVTPELIERRAELYLRGIGMQFLTGTMMEFGNRGETPSLLIQIGVSPGERGMNTFVTLNLVRERGSSFSPQLLYVVQQRGLTRHTVTRNYLMRETDLALNMLREDLRRSWSLR